MAGYWILKNPKCSKFCLTASLPAHIRKHRGQTTALQHNNGLISKVCLLGFWQVWGLYASLLLLSFNRLFFSVHAAKPYWCVAVYLDATASILKRLYYYSRGIGQVQVRYFECKTRVKYCWSGHGSIDIMRSGCCHFVPSFISAD